MNPEITWELVIGLVKFAGFFAFGILTIGTAFFIAFIGIHFGVKLVIKIFKDQE